MPTSLTLRIARLLLALFLLSMAIYWGTDDELPMDAGTVVLALVAAWFVIFSKTNRSAAYAVMFLILVPVVQNAVEVYFDVGVQQRGMPWPWVASKGATIGSIQEQVGQVATTAFAILALVGSALLAPKITQLAKRTRSDA